MDIFNTDLSTEMMVNESNWQMIKAPFHRDLTQIIDGIIRNTTASRFLRDDYAKKQITDCIAKNTGMLVKINSQYRTFAMMPPDLNRNHILTDTELREYYQNKELKRRQGEIKSSVDLKNFKVSGDFSKIEVELFLDPDLMWSNLISPAQISAVILHEVGHMFSYFALSAYTYSINLPMLGTINRLAKTENTEEIEMILQEWNGYDTTLTKVTTKELANKKKEVIVTAIVSNQIQDTKSLMRQRDYEEVNTEHLADKFAVRCGAGGDLAQALDTIMAIYGSRQRSLSTLIISEIIVGLLILIFTAFTVITITTIVFPLMIGIPVVMGLIEGASNAGDGTYDTELNRFGRIRDDMVNMLKDKEIDKAVGKRIRDDIRRVDMVIKNYKNYKSLIGMFADMIFPSKRRLMAQTEFYRELEKLSNNDLFVAAYDLRQLG